MICRFEAWLWRLFGRMNFASSNATQLQRGVLSYVRLPGLVLNGNRQPHVRLAEDGTLEPGANEDGTHVLRVPQHSPFPSATTYRTVIGAGAKRIQRESVCDLVIPTGCWVVFVAVNDAYGEETAWGCRYENLDGKLSVVGLSEANCWPVVDKRVNDGLLVFA